MKQNFKIVAKYWENGASIVCEGQNGNVQEICRILFPMDGQLGDNIASTEAIINILKRRIRKSL